jgi:regulator of replication initiation timing
MTTNNSSNTNPTKSKNQNFLAIAVTLGVILLAIIGFLAYNNISKARELDQTVTELEESQKLRQELETQYNQALADLEGQKTTNQELNAVIDQQKAELEQQKNKIAEMLKNKGKLDKARVEIDNLKSQVTQYLAQIDKLKSENEALTGENKQLSEEKQRLSTDLQSKTSENEELSSAKAQLVSEKDALTSKVNLASIIKTKTVTAVGQKVKGSGKVKDEDAARSVEQIKVCFTTLANEVAKSGAEKFYVRIINPLGETLAIEDMGSGMITNKKTGEDLRFTKMEEIDFNNEEAQACILWAPTNPSFTKGKYSIEVYNKGYLAGTGSLTLK